MNKLLTLFYEDYSEAARIAKMAASKYGIAIYLARDKGCFSVKVPFSFETDEPEEDEFASYNIDEDYTDPEEAHWEIQKRYNKPYDLDLERKLRYEFEYGCSHDEFCYDNEDQEANNNLEFWNTKDELNSDLSDYSDSLARSEEEGWYYDDD